jgi:ABC-type uncharacterized transport system permease subunit
MAPCVVEAQQLRTATTARPAALVPLYVSFSTLQALDAHSTLTAVENGARETNPLVRGAMDMPAGLVALKAGTAVGVIYLTEKLWKRNRVAAVVTMIALNSAYATIAAHNYRAGAQR